MKKYFKKGFFSLYTQINQVFAIFNLDFFFFFFETKSKDLKNNKIENN